MQKAHHTLIALYDASPEHAHFESPVLLTKARDLGKALGLAGLGIVARLGSPVVETVFESVSHAGKSPGTASVALSPAANPREHAKAYRLSSVSAPLIFTGRGALGADTAALASAGAVLIVGSYPGVLENILECAQDCELPIGILTDEDTSDIHERVRALHPHLAARLFVSHDPAVLVREIADEVRRRQLEVKLGK